MASSRAALVEKPAKITEYKLALVGGKYNTIYVCAPMLQWLYKRRHWPPPVASNVYVPMDA